MTYGELLAALLQGEPFELEGAHPAAARYALGRDGKIVYRCLDWESWWTMEAERPWDAAAAPLDGWKVGEGK